MASKIEWTDEVWNPVTGCTKVSQGCKHCYAERVAERFWKGRAFTDVQCHPERLDQPLRWRKPRRVFVNSMSDLFHEDVPAEFIDRVFAVMALSPQHTFQVLTKRPARMLEWARAATLERLAESIPTPSDLPKCTFEMRARLTGEPPTAAAMYHARRPAWPLPNVWLGVSVEDQATADERVPLLLQTPAAVRFVSYEPALGPVDFEPWLTASPSAAFLSGKVSPEMPAWTRLGSTALNWIIAGGESGPNARPAHPDWFRSVRYQCQAAGAPFFFKQWGEWKPIGQMADGESDRLYRPNVRANEECEDQAHLDDVHGRHCVVPTRVLHADGNHADNLDPGAWAASTFPTLSFRVGKKAAGRSLDGRTWDQFPKVQP